MHFGELIMERRRLRGWTRAETERRTGVDAQSIYRIETGRQHGPTESVVVLSAILGADLRLLSVCEPYEARIRAAKENACTR